MSADVNDNSQKKNCCCRWSMLSPGSLLL